MDQYITYKPQGGDALVKSFLSTIYNHPGDEAFYAAIDTHLLSTTWVQKMSWINDTDAEQQQTYEYATGLTITSGREITNAINLGATFEGLSISFSNTVKVFQTYETTTTQKSISEVHIPPRSSLYFYQKYYTFKSSMFFILDAWGQEWNAGSWGGYDITRKECVVDIMSEEYITKDNVLDGSTTGTFNVATVGRVAKESDRSTRKRENLTGDAKKALDNIVISTRIRGEDERLAVTILFNSISFETSPTFFVRDNESNKRGWSADDVLEFLRLNPMDSTFGWSEILAEALDDHENGLPHSTANARLFAHTLERMFWWQLFHHIRNKVSAFASSLSEDFAESTAWRDVETRAGSLLILWEERGLAPSTLPSPALSPAAGHTA
ncbi:predicted protein [Postia placenta Mad-698-R]|nr:predicted protein [Postia placenta Mad-698-R]